eukprot:TRINITY_DN1918_c1_g1_i2.p1 TRINITY_DN1918_c1_g1~~TRINITY_DN1918_c1_g1_i2.p1  ORF type:complete len:140 (-),score=9.06 TRINITY_DN1918_c1_g1_i2:180-599(-)
MEMDAHKRNHVCTHALTAAEYMLNFRGDVLRDRLVRSMDPSRMEEAARQTGGILTHVDVSGSVGSGDSTYLTLAEMCAFVASLGVDLRDESSCSEVSGSLQLLTTTIPCLSAVGCLIQFRLLFPKISIEFCELVSEMPD